jgi:hypothetical protein
MWFGTVISELDPERIMPGGRQASCAISSRESTAQNEKGEVEGAK